MTRGRRNPASLVLLAAPPPSLARCPGSAFCVAGDACVCCAAANCAPRLLLDREWSHPSSAPADGVSSLIGRAGLLLAPARRFTVQPPHVLHPAPLLLLLEIRSAIGSSLRTMPGSMTVTVSVNGCTWRTRPTPCGVVTSAPSLGIFLFCSL